MNKSFGSGGLLVALFAVFLIMKLCGIGEVADWPWWMVTLPLWILPLVLIMILMAIVAIPLFGFIFMVIAVGVVWIVEAYHDWRQDDVNNH